MYDGCRMQWISLCKPSKRNFISVHLVKMVQQKRPCCYSSDEAKLVKKEHVHPFRDGSIHLFGCGNRPENRVLPFNHTIPWDSCLIQGRIPAVWNDPPPAVWCTLPYHRLPYEAVSWVCGWIRQKWTRHSSSLCSSFSHVPIRTKNWCPCAYLCICRDTESSASYCSS